MSTNQESDMPPSPPRRVFQPDSDLSDSDVPHGPADTKPLPPNKPPSFQEFSQAPSTHGSLNKVQSVGLSNNKIEHLTREQYYANVSGTAKTLQARSKLAGISPRAAELMEEAAQILEKRYHGK